MNEENKINSKGFSLNSDAVGIDNQVKINFTYKVPMTNQMKTVLEGADNNTKAERKLAMLLGATLEDIGRRDNKNFKGKFYVTTMDEYLEGVYDSDSMVRSSLEAEMRKNLSDRLKELSGDEQARADINLACSF